MLDPKRPEVLINDKIVGIGDTIEEVKVLAIDTPDYIEVDSRGQRHQLILI